MNPIILGIFVLGVITTVMLPLLVTRNPSHRNRFEQMNGPDLIQASLRAGMIKGRLRLAAYLVPLPIIVLVRCFAVDKVQTLIIGTAFVVIFACLSGAQVFGALEKLITAEMKKRQSAPDKE